MSKHRLRAFLPLLALSALSLTWPTQAGEPVDADLIIPVSELSGQIRYYSVIIDNYRLVFMAVIAPDKSDRVVFNACQVCGPAGFRQEGDSVICTACENAFKISTLEKQRGGCNPIPVGLKNRSRSGGNIVISKAFLKQAKDYFVKTFK